MATWVPAWGRPARTVLGPTPALTGLGPAGQEGGRVGARPQAEHTQPWDWDTFPSRCGMSPRPTHALVPAGQGPGSVCGHPGVLPSAVQDAGPQAWNWELRPFPPKQTSLGTQAPPAILATRYWVPPVPLL